MPCQLSTEYTIPTTKSTSKPLSGQAASECVADRGRMKNKKIVFRNKDGELKVNWLGFTFRVVIVTASVIGRLLSD